MDVREVTPPADPICAAMGPEGDLVALRFERGCRCFGAWSASQVVSYGWLSSGPEWIGELGLQIRPGPGEAYVWNCVTLPEHRRQGVFRSLLRCVMAAAAAEGLRRLWIGSVEDYADRAIVEAGFKPVLRFRSRTLAGLRRLTVEAAGDAEPALVDAGLSAISHPLGAGVLRVKTRRH